MASRISVLILSILLSVSASAGVRRIGVVTASDAPEARRRLAAIGMGGDNFSVPILNNSDGEDDPARAYLSDWNLSGHEFTLVVKELADLDVTWTDIGDGADTTRLKRFLDSRGQSTREKKKTGR